MQVELRQIQKRLGITAVLVTHDQEEALTMADRVVIMRSGKLEQVGTPEEIYSRPTTRFVASFIGAANFLHGSVAGQDGSNILVRLSSGGQVCLPRTKDLQNNLLISVRPEAINLSGALPGKAASANGTPATVQQVVYRGQTTHVHMKLGDGEPLLAFLPNRQGERVFSGIGPGDQVFASWLPESNWVVADA
jgi:putative spermidine/putrescine transport system ATP-binding protein